ncbi:DUF748 domain-containing protein [Achromobacter pulmonis]|uniref:DUF748 domain-containing protein n=1 Tax=Achromobacter pulmonis TaxID=1389932 RepID=A0A6S7C0I7_9BURK|nr:DUF748 domain-containing protein [Achromobacter pulmonis]CAB3827189.1 hypothetical protein LMG26788_00578 [Achromobacter pulmonis]
MSDSRAAPRYRSIKGKWPLIALAIVVSLAALAGLGRYVAERRIAGLLGPRAHVGQVSLGFGQVVLTDVKIEGAEGMAAASARRVVAEPEWGSLLRRVTVLRRIRIEQFDFAVVRGRDGDMRISPALQASLRAADHAGDAAHPRSPLRADEVILDGGRLEFVDEAISTPAHRIPFDNVSASLRPLALPAAGQPSAMQFQGSVRDNRAGAATVRARGSLVVGGSDADMTVAVRNMDIRYAAPYLADNGAGSLAGGTMDLDMRTRVTGRQLNASGTVALRDLRFSGDGSLFSLPRKAVLAALENRHGTLRMAFKLSGSLDDPKFSASRGFAAQIARGFGHAIGVGAEGAAGGVAGAVKDLGDAISDLFDP